MSKPTNSSDYTKQEEDKYCETLTFRLISSGTYLKQASNFTSRLGNNSEKNQISVQIFIKKLLHNQNHGEWSDCVSILRI